MFFWLPPLTPIIEPEPSEDVNPVKHKDDLLDELFPSVEEIREMSFNRRRSMTEAAIKCAKSPEEIELHKKYLAALEKTYADYKSGKIK